jgi:hypothetical protein
MRVRVLDRTDVLRLRRWLRRHAPESIRDTAWMALDSLRSLQRTLDARERDERWRAAEAERDRIKSEFDLLSKAVNVGDRARLSRIIAELIKEKGATNYLQALLDLGDEEVVVLFQLRGKKSPAELVQEAEAALAERTKERDEARAELDLWQHCANCHERMDAPGHCSLAESESEAGYRVMWEQQIERAEQAEAALARVRKTLERFEAASQRRYIGCQCLTCSLFDDLRAALTPAVPEAKPCDHKFIDSTRCVKCGWRPEPPSVIAEVIAERRRQDAKWGGPVNDDTHSIYDWWGFIMQRCVGYAYPGGKIHERRDLIEVSALAIAAVESMDRKQAVTPEPPKGDPR